MRSGGSRRGIGWTRSLEVRRCTLYIVKRTQVKRTQRAARERYLNEAEERKAAMLSIVGMRKDRADIQDSTAYIRELRKDRRSEPLP